MCPQNGAKQSEKQANSSGMLGRNRRVSGIRPSALKLSEGPEHFPLLGKDNGILFICLTTKASGYHRLDGFLLVEK